MFQCTELFEGVTVVQEKQFATNAVVVQGRQKVLVIDSFLFPHQGEALVKLASEITGQPPSYLVNTHGHRDHIFGNQAFSCPIISSETCRRHLQSLLRHLWSHEKLCNHHPGFATVRVVPPEIGFRKELYLDLGAQEVQLLETGGHAPGHCVAFLPSSGVLVTSDLVMHGLPFLLDANVQELMNGLNDLQHLGARYVVPGHGAVGERTLLQEALDCLGGFCADVQELAERQLAPSEITAELTERYAGGNAKLRQWLGLGVERLLVGPYGSLRGLAFPES